MNILFIFLSFNGISSNKGMYGDLVTEFVSKGHSVTVIAPSLIKQKEYVRIEKLENLKILWVKCPPLFHTNILQKTISNFLIPILFNFALNNHLNQIDLILSPTPPILFGNLIRKLKKKYNALFYLILRDIFPQNALDLGLINDNIFYKYLKQKESFLYELSDGIGCMSTGNIQYILKNNSSIPFEKLFELPNWLEIKTNSNKTSILKKFNLEGKIIALFGGNIGIPQSVENIIHLAQIYNTTNDIHFLIVGKGTKFNKVKSLIEKFQLENVTLLSHLPRVEYQALVSQIDIGLISLNPNFTIPNIPSRTLGYWSEKKPVFAILDKSTDFGTNFIDKYNAGVWCLADSPESYKEKFDILYNSSKLRREMGSNGFKALQQEFSSTQAYYNIINFYNKYHHTN